MQLEFFRCSTVPELVHVEVGVLHLDLHLCLEAILLNATSLLRDEAPHLASGDSKNDASIAVLVYGLVLWRYGVHWRVALLIQKSNSSDTYNIRIDFDRIHPITHRLLKRGFFKIASLGDGSSHKAGPKF